MTGKDLISAAWTGTGRAPHQKPTIHGLSAGVRAVPGFKFYTFSQLQGIVAAARQSQAPTLVQVSKRAWGLFETELLGWFVERYIPEWSEGYALAHLDHGWSLEVLQQALELGFQSVMFDGSHLSIRENIACTREAVVGRSGVPSTRTSVSEAVKLYEATEPDFLAVSIGNSRGNSEVSLDFGLAEGVRSRVGCPLAFLCGTLVMPQSLARAVRGCSKALAQLPGKVGIRPPLDPGHSAERLPDLLPHMRDSDLDLLQDGDDDALFLRQKGVEQMHTMNLGVPTLPSLLRRRLQRLAGLHCKSISAQHGSLWASRMPFVSILQGQPERL